MNILRKYILLPTIIGTIIYGMLQLSYFAFLITFNHPGISFILEIMVFAIFSTVVVPILIQLYYKINLWEILHIERSTWIMIVVFSIGISFLFYHSNEFVLGRFSFSRSGLGKFSFGSLIMAPIFEEFFFRGILLSLTCQVFSKNTSIKVNALIFSLWHFGIIFSYGFVIQVPLLIIVTGIFGYFLASFQFVHRNLGISMLLHALATSFIAATGFLIP